MSDGCDTRFRLPSLWARKCCIPLLGYCLLTRSSVNPAPHAMQLPLVLSFLHSPRLRARCLQGMCLWRVARYYYFLFSCSSPLYLMTQEGAVHIVFKPQKKRVPVLTPHFSKELTVWIYWEEHTQPCSHPQIRLESSWAPRTIQ